MMDPISVLSASSMFTCPSTMASLWEDTECQGIKHIPEDVALDVLHVTGQIKYRLASPSMSLRVGVNRQKAALPQAHS